MMRKLVLSCAAAGIMIASAAQSYRVTFYQPAIINGTEVKAGNYFVEVNGTTAVIRRGKLKVEAPVKVEAADRRFSSTSVRYENGDGRFRMKEIRLGGTRTKLVFD